MRPGESIDGRRKETCPECRKRPVRAKGLCGPCYKRLVWRPRGGAAVQKDRDASRAYKARNPDHIQAYNREYDAARAVPCPACGRPMSRAIRESCAGCVADRAKARADRIVELWDEGLSRNAIAEAIGTTRNTLCVDLDQLRKAGRIGYRYKAYERKVAA